MRIAILIGVLALAAACGGGAGDDERVLHLRTGDYTEAELLAQFRAVGLSQSACNTLHGLSPREVVDIINALEPNPDRPVIQTPDPDDDIRQGELMLEECNRLY